MHLVYTFHSNLISFLFKISTTSFFTIKMDSENENIYKFFFIKIVTLNQLLAITHSQKK